MVLAWCGRVMMVWLGSPLEVVDSLVGLGSKAAHRTGVCRMRTLGQLQREVPVRMTGDHQWWEAH
jgi:hypothetical protein